MGPTWPSKPHSKCNLAALGSIFAALAPLRIGLPPARELNSHGSGIFVVQVLLDCCFVALQWVSDAFWTQLGASWTPLGLNLETLRRLFGSTWRLLGASWAQLGASKPHSKLNLASVGPHLSAQSRTPSSTWRLLGAIWPSKPQNCPPSRKLTSHLPSSCPSRGLQTFERVVGS